MSPIPNTVRVVMRRPFGTVQIDNVARVSPPSNACPCYFIVTIEGTLHWVEPGAVERVVYVYEVPDTEAIEDAPPDRLSMGLRVLQYLEAGGPWEHDLSPHQFIADRRNSGMCHMCCLPENHPTHTIPERTEP